MKLPWFRFYIEFATDARTQMLSEKNQRRFVMLMYMRAVHGDVQLEDDMVEFTLRISREEWKATQSILIKAKLINEKNAPPNWTRRQYQSDSSKERTARYRKRKKEQGHGDVTVTPPETETETDTERNKNSSSVTAKKNVVPYKKIITLYHQCLPELPAVMKLTAKRKAQIKQRFKEDLKNLEQWENYFDFVGQSDFLMGRVEPVAGRTSFRADIEWLTNASNFTKISEDKYHV